MSVIQVNNQFVICPNIIWPGHSEQGVEPFIFKGHTDGLLVNFVSMRGIMFN